MTRFLGGFPVIFRMQIISDMPFERTFFFVENLVKADIHEREITVENSSSIVNEFVHETYSNVD